MSQAAALWSGLPPHAQSPDARNGYASPGLEHTRSNSYMASPFDLADILNPARDKRMSLDYSPSPSASSHSGAAPHGKLCYSYLFTTCLATPLLTFCHLGHAPSHLSGSGFEQQDGMDVAQEQNGFDYFPGANGAAFGARYRTNASSSSSLGQGYGNMGADQMYPHAPSPFAESLSSFSQPSHNSFDLVNGLSSSYSSGKVSPLTPNDPVIGLQNSPGFPNIGGGGVSKDFSNYNDLIGDRRRSSVSSGSFQSDFHDDFNGNGALGLGFPPPSSLQHFQERISHFPGGQMHHHSSVDMMRGVNPHATHGGVGFDDMGPFPSISPATDLLRTMPSHGMGVDELSRKLQVHAGMAAATDLQSFIR